ncbi:MAG: PH domain-containing protein [Bacillus sp. (in: firmicutes)]
MLKKFASDALGLSDVGTIIAPADFDKTDADDYVLHEDGEKIYFLIKTKADEYCFTNLALIHVDGENAVSSKRVLKRYSYAQYKFSNVLLETAGKIDLDVEIKFNLGNAVFDIDVKKSQIDQLIDLYKALVYMAELAHEDEIHMSYANNSIEKTVLTLQQSRIEEKGLTDSYKEITDFTFRWLTDAYTKYNRKDYGDVFEKYINN